MSIIIEHLYVGDIDDATNELKLLKLDIHAILTIDCKPISKDFQSEYKYLYIHGLDVFDFDLLSHLNSAIDFIDQTRDLEKNVLVHCFAGRSRSGMVCIAYLMKHLNLSVEEALHFARKMRPEIMPNHGFLEQLNLFETMNYKVNEKDIIYRQYKLKLLSNEIIKMSNVDILSKLLVHDPTYQDESNILFRCKKCRIILFRETAILKHQRVTENKICAFKKKSQSLGKSGNMTQSEKSCQQSIFVEPINWMKNSIDQTSGKLCCPKCFTKLGSYNWAGDQCNCSQWIVPAFQISNIKLDNCPIIINIQENK